jgi:cell division protein FtsI (penicillin-binding protein 3)
MVWVFVVVLRLGTLQFAKVAVWEEWAAKQHRTKITMASVRGSIEDRNGQPLAISIPSGSVYAHPRQITNPLEVAQRVAPLLSVDSSTIYQKLITKKSFVWLQRQGSLEAAGRVAALNMKGLGFFHESKRVYPRGSSGSTVVGKVGIDGEGLSGLELKYDTQLKIKGDIVPVYRDAMGNLIQDSGVSGAPIAVPRGKSLALTVDADLQDILQDELVKGREFAQAKAAYGVLINARSGEILAMSQAPSADFNQDGAVKSDSSVLKNWSAETVLEPGSIMKPLVAAAAIEEGFIEAQEMVDCEGGRYRVGRHTIKDVHPISLVPFYEVVVRSSNIGMTKVGERMGKELLYRYLKLFGFGEPSGLGFPGESAGILRHMSKWATVDVATHSFGQGIAVTPLQMVRAVATVANGGIYQPLSLIKGEVKHGVRRVLSSQTAQIAKEMMYGVVEHPRGTGKKAAIEGVRVGGKTGTAQKARLGGRGYASGKYIASFVGFVDASSLGIDELLTLVISVDEPTSSSIYGGVLAAPVFQRVMGRSLSTLVTRRELSMSNRESSESKESSPENPPFQHQVNLRTVEKAEFSSAKNL